MSTGPIKLVLKFYTIILVVQEFHHVDAWGKEAPPWLSEGRSY